MTPENQKPLTPKQAAGIANVSPDTVIRWCERHGIGKHLHPKAPWRVDPVGLAIVMTGDPDALAEYQRGHRAGDWHPSNYLAF